MTITKNNLSPNQRALQRLLKNKPAIFGIAVISLALLVAIFGYMIVPDNSPNANEQISELALKNPGFKISLLKVRKNQQVEKRGLFKTMMFGQPNPYKLIPINSIEFIGDSVQINRYQGQDKTTGVLHKSKSEKYHLLDVCYSLSLDKDFIKKGNQFDFYNFEGSRQTISKEEIINKIEKEQVDRRTFHLGKARFGR